MWIEFLDKIVRVFMWHGVDQELVDATNYIKRNIVPKARLLLKVYTEVFGYEIRHKKSDVSPGRVSMYVEGKLGKEIVEIALILSKMFPYFQIYDISGHNEEKLCFSYELVLEHPRGYSFAEEDDYVTWEI